ncbi:2-phospho-L-lactate guanylyltransferase [Serinicoccus kebangsaanensis]|uniref:2-phospho-L-lactate guanylyltransferase n=1 Tax=Serinicoccus kebangsaanensis TaxID=2602069 RepID=UPI00124C42F5|nr:2-phospho-L-lactate guanylyltransferase [Serinicoccus kebangsaanensis]
MPPNPQAQDAGPRWRLVVPIQDADRAKSRLVAPHGVHRADLARAIGMDTVAAVCAALPPASVTVVTSDPGAAAWAGQLGARAVPDPGSGLNAAIRAGLEDAAEQGPPASGWAVLLGDLPCLRPEDLGRALARAGAHERAVVPDADGSGTVLLTSTAGIPEPRFGAGSAARHGVDATVLDLDLPRLRRDVDTADDLALALRLRVGPRTTAVLREAGAIPP